MLRSMQQMWRQLEAASALGNALAAASPRRQPPLAGKEFKWILTNMQHIEYARCAASV